MRFRNYCLRWFHIKWKSPYGTKLRPIRAGADLTYLILLSFSTCPSFVVFVYVREHSKMEQGYFISINLNKKRCREREREIRRERKKNREKDRSEGERKKELFRYVVFLNLRMFDKLIDKLWISFLFKTYSNFTILALKVKITSGILFKITLSLTVCNGKVETTRI